jgi:hypothetical protein
MNYKDMTFCPQDHCKHFGDDCHRSLTIEVLTAAHDWWGDIGGEPPVAVFTDIPDCYEE